MKSLGCLFRLMLMGLQACAAVSFLVATALIFFWGRNDRGLAHLAKATEVKPLVMVVSQNGPAWVKVRLVPASGASLLDFAGQKVLWKHRTGQQGQVQEIKKNGVWTTRQVWRSLKEKPEGVSFNMVDGNLAIPVGNWLGIEVWKDLPQIRKDDLAANTPLAENPVEKPAIHASPASQRISSGTMLIKDLTEAYILPDTEVWAFGNFINGTPQVLENGKFYLTGVGRERFAMDVEKSMENLDRLMFACLLLGLLFGFLFIRNLLRREAAVELPGPPPDAGSRPAPPCVMISRKKGAMASFKKQNEPSTAIITGILLLGILVFYCGKAYSLSANLRFSHREHSQRNVSCETCHVLQGVTDQKPWATPDGWQPIKRGIGPDGKPPQISIDANFGRPPEAVCLKCHSQRREKGDCRYCHLTRPESTTRDRTRLPEQTKFKHDSHLQADCLDCHPKVGDWDNLDGCQVDIRMKTCVSCHNGAKAKKTCTLCHAKVPRPMDHMRNYEKKHGIAYRFDPGSCSMCHEDSSCVACHSRKPRDHTMAWVSRRHGFEAQTNPDKCWACHLSGSGSSSGSSGNGLGSNVGGDVCQRCHKTK